MCQCAVVLIVGLIFLRTASVPAVAQDIEEVVVDYDRSLGRTTIRLIWKEDVTFEHSRDGRDLVIRFDRRIVAPRIEWLARELPEYVEYASLGFDSLLINLKPRVSTTVSGKGPVVDIKLSEYSKTAPAEKAPVSVSADKRLRFTLIKADLLSRSGRVVEGRRLLRRAIDRYPRSVPLLLQLASLEQQLDRPTQAIFLYNRALSVDPTNKDARRAKSKARRSIGAGRMDGTRVRFDFTRQEVEEGDTQLQPILQLDHTLADGWNIGVELERRKLKANAIRRSDLLPADFSGSRLRGEVTLSKRLPDGDEATGGFLFTQNRLGATAGYLMRHDIAEGFAETRFTADVRRPYWALLEGIIEDGYRSRFLLQHDWGPNEELLISGELGVNHYGLNGTPNAAASVNNLLSVTYLADRWFDGLAAQYQFDTETLFYRRLLVAPDGAEIRAMPVSTRQVHLAQLLYDVDVGDNVKLRASAGYSVDRELARGILGGIGITYEINADTQLGLSANQTVTADRGGNSVVRRIGGNLFTRF